MSGPHQLPLRFPEPRLNFDDMTLSASNRGAVAAVRRIQNWPYHVFCLIGPPRSGLTTLARAWADETSARYLTQADFSDTNPPELPEAMQACIAIDGADQIAHDKHLLTLISAMKRLNGRLLLTANIPPAQWRSSSPDLASRLKSAPLAEFGAPDETMMRARLQGAAHRNFIALPKKVEDYLVTRLGLSYAAIEDMVEALSGRMGGRELTVPLVRELIEEADGQ